MLDVKIWLCLHILSYFLYVLRLFYSVSIFVGELVRIGTLILFVIGTYRDTHFVRSVNDNDVESTGDMFHKVYQFNAEFRYFPIRKTSVAHLCDLSN